MRVAATAISLTKRSCTPKAVDEECLMASNEQCPSRFEGSVDGEWVRLRCQKDEGHEGPHTHERWWD